MIEFQHVDKFYGDFHALKDINLTIDKGEVVTLIGPSGSGKSTLLRCINRLEAITKGKLLINGVDISAKDTDIRKIRRNIGMVFQHFELYPHMTVLKNITLAPRKVLHVDEKEAEERAERFLKRVNLWDKRNSYPNQLSGGQKQRVAIARGLAMNPEIMLFDEPTSALDPETTGDVLDVMQRIAEEDKMTMVVVTHEMGFAREVSDRTIFMAEGLILEDRPSQDFFNAPQDERAQQFLNQIIRH
ncbi:amino acid ABC transporter ATP-binding protein [Bavariicoccus seileri]|uniref:amino acid ABC transporter ATP-binding protein n=1 Tax=Bavariicoccus seileri TaxID=549685 RepID=UPI003F90B500